MEFVGTIEKIEKRIYAALMIMLIVVLLAAILDLITLVFQALVTVSPAVVDTHEMIVLLGGFLLVLIGVELLDTIKVYFHENAIHVEIVVLLAIIAVARKVILIDPTTVSAFEYGFELMSIGVIVVGLSAGYFLIKKAGITIGPGLAEKKE
ncbi:MAG: phosphate-starvation-inducible PsiE family protein [Methanoregula sp.]|jgi:uncharacterized membrane protein (DUF373 family)|uniref:phosphate-starvation-inducible PsiE family protein n=1 Tax=Methanoregula sp. TaxID=2052170 RepID=UPI003C1C3362